MCGGHNSAYDDDEDCDTWTSAYENYIVCDDCIPPDAICSVKEWNERWTKKGKNTFDFDEMCWKKKKLKKKIKLFKPKKEEEGICCKCKTDYEVEQCMECDKYICEECDPNRMSAYTYDGEGIHCEQCAIAKGFFFLTLG